MGTNGEVVHPGEIENCVCVHRRSDSRIPSSLKQREALKARQHLKCSTNHCSSSNKQSLHVFSHIEQKGTVWR